MNAVLRGSYLLFLIVMHVSDCIWHHVVMAGIYQ